MNVTTLLGKHASYLGTAAIAFAPAVQADTPSDFPIEPAGIARAADTLDVCTEPLESSFTDDEFIGKNVFQDWNTSAEQRFIELVDKFALDEISPQEAAELQALQSARLVESAPRSYEEIVREFEIDQAANEAVEALNRLIESVRKPWKQ